jgi:hypothetical protein
VRSMSLLTVAAALAGSALTAQTPAPPAASPVRLAPPTADSLAAITSRGRALARYDRAAWRATDAVMALRKDVDGVHGYVGRLVGPGWTVSFGRMSEDSAAFLVAFEAFEVAGRPDSFTVVHHVPARRDTGEVARRARALDVARAEFGGSDRPYNSAILPVGDGSWWVYLVPAQTTAGVYPLGADVRYHVSEDGRRILAKRQLHKTILEFGATRDAPGPVESGVHAAVLDNIPEDTDVFHAIVRRPSVPQYIVTDAFMYRVDPSGVINYMGRREEVLGR